MYPSGALPGKRDEDQIVPEGKRKREREIEGERERKREREKEREIDRKSVV